MRTGGTRLCSLRLFITGEEMQTYLLIVYGILSFVFFLLFFFKEKNIKTHRIIFAVYFFLMAVSTIAVGKDTEYIRALFSWLAVYLFLSVLTYQFILPAKNRWVRVIGSFLFLALISFHLAMNANKTRQAFYDYQCKRPDHGEQVQMTGWQSSTEAEQRIFFVLFPERRAIKNCYKK